MPSRSMSDPDQEFDKEVKQLLLNGDQQYPVDVDCFLFPINYIPKEILHKDIYGDVFFPQVFFPACNLYLQVRYASTKAKL